MEAPLTETVDLVKRGLRGAQARLGHMLGRRDWPPGQPDQVPSSALRSQAPSGEEVFENYVASAPSAQATVDIFRGEWASKLPPPYEDVRAGSVPLFADERIDWLFSQLGGVAGKSVLELGPLEGGHTFMLQQAGASSVLAIEGNTRSYLRCLIVKELLDLRARFLCGDFVEWLRTADQAFDLCVASGVLYHIANPVELIDLVGKRSDHVFYWTHYFDAEVIGADHRLATAFGATLTAEHDGFVHTLHRRSYGASLDSGFCGGNQRFSNWLERQDLLGALRHFGYSDIDVAFDAPDHPNGPSLALVARRDGSGRSGQRG
ncbi:MAG: class I SAM-dependent methyltransferase [Actinomycetota bacterium]|nr:class I SAM-dependent methyltransferase [Actinomycetota bacterium]